MKKIAVINDLSGFGKCSLTAAIPVISALGVQCCPLTTAVFSNQTGYDSYYCIDCTEHMRSCIEEWKKLNVSFDAILTGFISSSRQGEIIADFIDSFKNENTFVVVDPVMADDGSIYDFYDDECVSSIMNLTQKADLITPNLTELCVICNKSYSKVNELPPEKKLNEIKLMSQSINEKSKKIIVTSGIPIGNGKVANAVYDNGKYDIISCEKLGVSFSGTGDILSSFVTAQYVKGISASEAVRQASDFIVASIKETLEDAKGNYNPADGIHFEKFLHTLSI